MAPLQRGDLPSGRRHFQLYGYKEGRRLRMSAGASFAAAKNNKLARVRPLLRRDLPYADGHGCLDFLTPELRERFAIIDSAAVSVNEYDGYALNLIEKHRDGLILDCGAGQRPVYYESVVNFEIVDYDTTGVRGMGEVLPFADNSFDAVLSLAVLEHVRDPFACAREIVRVLKPGGDLMCCVPFLQPLHGYPNHYYDMTEQGLKNLFPQVQVDRHEVYASVLPIWSLTWIVKSWAEGLTGTAKEEFLDLKMSELLDSGEKYLGRSFVTGLSPVRQSCSPTKPIGRRGALPRVRKPLWGGQSCPQPAFSRPWPPKRRLRPRLAAPHRVLFYPAKRIQPGSTCVDRSFAGRG